MFQPGDLIIYGNSGVCKVEEIAEPKLAISDQQKMYYKLVPVYSTETIFTPVDTGVFMRPIISREEAEALVAQIPLIREEIYHNRNLSQLRDHYETALQTHDCEDLVQLMKSVYSKGVDAAQNGKKLGLVDQKYQKRAEDLLYGELSVALDISREDVAEYIAATATAAQALS